jgi:hypothetical protein
VSIIGTLLFIRLKLNTGKNNLPIDNDQTTSLVQPGKCLILQLILFVVIDVGNIKKNGFNFNIISRL